MSATTAVPSGAPVPQPATLGGWGGGARARSLLTRPGSVEAAAAALQRASASGAIARGMGRSYGDAAQLTGGTVLDTTALEDFALHPEQGTVTAQAGVTIGALLRALVPAGWVLPVVPGTQHVTVGGAIASDIHGKSHGVDGTFGSHVQTLTLLTASGDVVELEPGSELFDATLGGMGLTGVIVSARIALRAVTSAILSVDTDRVPTLDDALAALAAPGGPYRVAWLDLLGPRGARGVVTRAEHVPAGTRDGAAVAARTTVPRRWPSGVLRASTVRAYNEFRYRTSPSRGRGRLEPYGPHMFPLDVLDAWPRLYGPHGFVQYQLVVPPSRVDVLHEAIDRLRRARVPCYLAVLKDFGPSGGAPLSFPIEGWTLALDLPRAAPNLYGTLDRLDELVAEAGGRVYLTKDSRLRPDAVSAMYPQLGRWQEVRERADPDRLWRSDLALRTGLVSR